MVDLGAQVAQQHGVPRRAGAELLGGGGVVVPIEGVLVGDQVIIRVDVGERLAELRPLQRRGRLLQRLAVPDQVQPWTVGFVPLRQHL